MIRSDGDSKTVILVPGFVVLLLGAFSFVMVSHEARFQVVIGIVITICGLVLFIFLRKLLIIVTKSKTDSGRTTKKVTEDERKQARLLEMGRAVSGLVHEFRNPIFSINSIGQIFERELSNPSHLELSRAILAETRRLNKMIEELLLYCRPAKLSTTSCDAAELWRATLNAHLDEFTRKAIKIETDFGQNCYAFLDEKQMGQAFQNLLTNALDAISGGGTITVTAGVESGTLVCSLSDTGVGIPSDQIDRVFDLFYSTKPKRSGVGLSVSKKIIEDHGGTLAVTSPRRELNKEYPGTTVTIRLPVRASMPAEPSGALPR